MRTIVALAFACSVLVASAQAAATVEYFFGSA